MPDNTRKTPYFLINLTNIKENYLEFKNSIASVKRNDSIAFALKANYDKNVINLLNELGSSFEVTSFYEFKLLLKRNISPQKIIINGSVTNLNHLKIYLELGAHIIVDSQLILNYIIRLNIDCSVGIRVNIDYLKKGNKNFKYENSRFGIDLNETNLFEKLTNTKVKISCIHSHNSNHTKNPKIYALILDELCNLIKKFNLYNVKKIDLGGGYKIAEKFWNFSDYTIELNNTLNNNNMAHIKLIYEPGNSLVRTSANYIIKIIDKKVINNRTYLITDGTKYHLELRNSEIPFDYDIQRNNQYNHRCILKHQIVTGCTCRNLDIFLELNNSLELEIGDVIIFYSVGAYALNRVPNFLIERPKVYYLKNNPDTSLFKFRNN